MLKSSSPSIKEAAGDGELKQGSTDDVFFAIQ